MKKSVSIGNLFITLSDTYNNNLSGKNKDFTLDVV